MIDGLLAWISRGRRGEKERERERGITGNVKAGAPPPEMDSLAKIGQ